MSSPGRCPTCRRPHRRSTQANAYYWLLLHLIAEQVKPGGQSYSPDTWHQYAKSRWIGCDDIRLPNGKVLSQARSSASLDVAEFNEYVAKVEAWAAERDVFLADREAA